MVLVKLRNPLHIVVVTCTTDCACSLFLMVVITYNDDVFEGRTYKKYRIAGKLLVPEETS